MGFDRLIWWRTRRAGLAAVLVAVGLAIPASAAAHDTYVNQGTGHDSGNDCSQPATPCKTLARGVNQAIGADDVFVAGGYTYTASVTLANDVNLIHKNFGGASGPAILDNGSAAHPAITVTGDVNRVEGFTIRSETLPMLVEASAAIRYDKFDTPAAVPEAIHVTSADLTNVLVAHNTFRDPTPLTAPSATQMGIDDESHAVLDAKKNKFKDLYNPIQVNGPLAITDIDDNTFTGTHGLVGYAPATIFVPQARSVEISGNRLRDPSQLSGIGAPAGIEVGTEAFIYRNLITGYEYGISVGDASHVTRLQDNVVVNPDSNAIAVDISDYDLPDPGLDARLLNDTLWGPGQAVQLQKTQVKVDSTILGGQGIKAFYGGDTCTITHTRGPAKKQSATGCKDVQTTANPRLKADGYHLKGSSPMIDRGPKHKNTRFEHDIDGDKRKLPGDCHARHPVKRVDIGADEFKCPRHR